MRWQRIFFLQWSDAHRRFLNTAPDILNKGKDGLTHVYEAGVVGGRVVLQRLVQVLGYVEGQACLSRRAGDDFNVHKE